MYKIYVNDAELDIDPATIIAVTLQAADIASGDMTIRKANFTNQISVPKTPRNKIIFGVSDDIHSTSDFPFVINSVRIISSGVQILTGTILLQNTDTKFNLRIYSDVKSVATNIGNKVLSELDFGDTPVTWDATYIDSRRNATTGFCTPVLNYGQIDRSAAYGVVSDYYLPCVSLKDIIAAIFDNAGYTVSGDFYDNDAYFNNMVLSYSRKDWPGANFTMNQVLSDEIKQADFLRDISIKFGLFFKLSGSDLDGFDIELLTLESILNDEVNAVDWSSKRANSKEVLSYNWDGWTKANIFTYPERAYSDYAEQVAFGYKGEGQIEVANENIAPSRDVYESLTGLDEVTLNGVIYELPGHILYKVASVDNRIFGATMPVWTSTPTTYDEFDNDPIPMLCLLRSKTTVTSGVTAYVETTIRYDGNDRSDYKIAYVAPSKFCDLPLTGTHWRKTESVYQVGQSGFLDTYYGTFEAVVGTKPKKTIRQYLLTERDIYELDLFKLIYDDGDYFIINKVQEFVPNRLTTVELLRKAKPI